MPSSGWIDRIEARRLPVERRLGGKRLVRHGAELDGDLGDLARQALAGAEIEWHVLPAPVVHEELQGRERLRLRVRAARPLPRGSPAQSCPPLQPRPYCPRTATRCTASGGMGRTACSTSTFLLRISSAFEGDHRFHGHQAEQLQQVVLHHVAQGAGAVVVAAAVLHAHLLGHRDGHVIDVAAVPDRLEEGIGEAERQDVLHRLLAQVMVDAEDLGFVEAARPACGSAPAPNSRS